MTFLYPVPPRSVNHTVSQPTGSKRKRRSMETVEQANEGPSSSLQIELKRLMVETEQTGLEKNRLIEIKQLDARSRSSVMEMEC